MDCGKNVHNQERRDVLWGLGSLASVLPAGLFESCCNGKTTGASQDGGRKHCIIRLTGF